MILAGVAGTKHLLRSMRLPGAGMAEKALAGCAPGQARLATATPVAAMAMPTTRSAERRSPNGAKASTATTGGTR